MKLFSFKTLFLGLVIMTSQVQGGIFDTISGYLPSNNERTVVIVSAVTTVGSLACFVFAETDLGKLLCLNAAVFLIAAPALGKMVQSAMQQNEHQLGQ